MNKLVNGILLKHGSTIDETELTATPPKVRKNKLFIGTTGEMQAGEVDEIAPETRSLSIGGTLPIKAGFHSSTGTVRQSVLTMGGVTVYPTAERQVVEVGGKYMTGDVVAAPITNLLPQYIKKGVTILGVTGTYEGYH